MPQKEACRFFLYLKQYPSNFWIYELVPDASQIILKNACTTRSNQFDFAENCSYLSKLLFAYDRVVCVFVSKITLK